MANPCANTSCSIRFLLALTLSGSWAEAIDAQASVCDGYAMINHPNNAVTPLLDREVIIIHGFVDEENYPQTPLDDRCDATKLGDRLHGYWRADDAGLVGARWTAMVLELQRAGYRVRFWKWPTYLGMTEAAMELKTWLSSNVTASELVLVGHSMGGLVALQALTTELSSPDLRANTIRVVTLGSPHQGTNTGNNWALNSVAGQEVKPNTPFIMSLQSRRGTAEDAITYIIGGQVSFDYHCSAKWVGGPIFGGDCVVTVSSSYDGGPDVQEGPHRILLNGGAFDGYDHSQIGLDYVDSGFPSDPSGGQYLYDRIHQLLIEGLAPVIVPSQASVPLTDAASTTLTVRPQNPGSLVGLRATIQSITGGQAWLQVNLGGTRASASAPATLTLTSTPSGLPPGTYSANVRLDAAGAPSSLVSVALTVTPRSSPVLTANPTSIIGGGTTTLFWSAVSGATSYMLERTLNRTYTDLAPVTTTSLSVQEPIAVSSSPVTIHYRVRANNSGYSNVVSVTAIPTPTTGTMAADPTAIESPGFTGGAAVFADVSLLIPGYAAFTWSATARVNNGPQGWLRPQRASGDQSQQLQVRLDPINITANGTYTGQVEVVSATASNNPLVIPVTFTVSNSANSGVDLVIDRAFWTSLREPCNTQHNALELNWVVRNGGPSTWASGADQALDFVWWDPSPNLTVPELVSRNEIESSPFGNDPNFGSFASGQTTTNRDGLTLPNGDCPLGYSYLYILTDMPYDYGDGLTKGIVPESNDTDLDRPNNLFVFEIFNPRPPNLTVQPAQLTVDLVQGEVTAGSLTLANGGDLALDWSVTTAQAGVTLSPSGGQVPAQSSATLRYVINSAQFPIGATNLALDLTSNGGSVSLPVTVTVTPVPVIALSRSFVGFSAVASTAPPPAEVLDVTNAGPAGTVLSGLSIGQVSYAPGQPTGWLELPLLSSMAAPSVLTLSVASQALPPGTYSASVIIASSVAGVVPQTVAVTLTVDAAPVIAVTCPTPGWAMTVGSALPAPINCNVVNGGGGALTGLTIVGVQDSRGQPVPWMTAVLAAADAPTLLTAHLSTSEPAGTYQASIILRATSAAQVVVPVTLSVSPRPMATLAVTPSGLGTGRITSNPAGINCTLTGGVPGGTCSADFDQSVRNIEVGSTPGAGSVFTGWNGYCVGNVACVVSMAGGNVSLGAAFDAQPALADLVVENLTVTPYLPVVGAQTTVAADLRNLGGTDAANVGWTITFSVVPAGSNLAGVTLPGVAVPVVQSGSSQPIALSDIVFDLPGPYQLTLSADPERMVPEADEANNTNIYNFAVGHSSAVTLVMLVQPGDGIKGQPLAVQPIIGLLDAQGRSVPQANLEVEARVNSGMGQLSGTRSVVTDMQGRANFQDLQVSMAGMHTLAFYSAGLAATVSNGFNIRTPGPDLVASTMVVRRNQLVAGEWATIDIAIDNLGTDTALGNWRWVIFASQDRAYDVGDCVLDQASEGLVPPETSRRRSAYFNLGCISSDSTFLGLIADVDGTVAEGDETNNLYTAPFVVAPAPASTLALATEPAGAISGLPFQTQPVIQVQGAQGQPVRLGGVLVTATVAAGSGQLIGSTTVSTDTSGMAAFTSLGVTGTGAHALGFAASSLSGTVSQAFQVSPAPATVLTVVTQPGGAVSGAPFLVQPVIELRSALNQVAPQGGVVVTASKASGPGTLAGSLTAITDSQGRAQFTDLMIDRQGEHTLAFAATSLASAVSQMFTVTPAPATSLAMATEPGGAVSGFAFTTQPVVELRDARGLAVRQAGVQVLVGLASGPGQLSGMPTAFTDSLGRAAFAGLTIVGAGPHALDFSAIQLLPVVSRPFNVASAPPASLVLVQEPAGAVSGAIFTTQPVLELRDARNQPVHQGGVQVQAAIASGGGQLSGTLGVQTDTLGRAAFTDLEMSGQGSHTIRFTSPNLAPATSQPFVVGAAPATRLALVRQPGGAVSGIALTVQPVVELRDAQDQPVPQRDVVVTASKDSGTGSLGGTLTAVTDSVGRATFATLQITGQGSHSLAFAALSLTGVSSELFTVGGAPPTSLEVASQPGGAVSGSPFLTQPIIQLRDAQNQAVRQSGVSITASKASGSGTLGGALNAITDTAGRASFTNLKVTGTGAHILLFAASHLASASSQSFIVAPPPGTPATVDSMVVALTGGAPLSPGQIALHDCNTTGAFDIGDLLCFLDQHPTLHLSPGARTALRRAHRALELAPTTSRKREE